MNVSELLHLLHVLRRARRAAERKMAEGEPCGTITLVIGPPPDSGLTKREEEERLKAELELLKVNEIIAEKGQ